MSTIHKRASQASFWSLTTNISVGLINFLTTAILARLLKPEEFGLIGIAGLVLGIVGIFGKTGLGSALIYKKNPDDIYYSTVFWANSGVGILLAGCTLLLAYPASLFFREPVVFTMLTVLSVSFILPVISCIHSIKLQKEFDYLLIGVGSAITALVSSLCAILTAWYGYGVWSLVIRCLLDPIIYSLWLIAVIRWHPQWVFDFTKFKELFHYSRNLLAQGILNFFSQNIDYLMIGRLFGKQKLGYYKLAYSLPHIPYDEFTKRITAVLFPVLCKVKDDTYALKSGYLRALMYNTAIIMPAMIVFFFLAEPFVKIVYSPKWIVIVPTVKILTFVSILRCLTTFTGSLFCARGRTDIGVKFDLVVCPVTVIALLLCTRYDIEGVAYAILCIMVLSFIILYYIVIRVVDVITLPDILKTLLPGITASVCVYLFLIFTGPVFSLLAQNLFDTAHTIQPFKWMTRFSIFCPDLFNLGLTGIFSCFFIGCIYMFFFKKQLKDFIGFVLQIVR
ncbi:lipopolysaccharide biosynthesis protein [bacterium]|nr:lipopolysaccharide biosynthesis protein [bacterium]